MPNIYLSCPHISYSITKDRDVWWQRSDLIEQDIYLSHSGATSVSDQQKRENIHTICVCIVYDWVCNIRNWIVSKVWLDGSKEGWAYSIQVGCYKNFKVFKVKLKLKVYILILMLTRCSLIISEAVHFFLVLFFIHICQSFANHWFGSMIILYLIKEVNLILIV